MTDTGGANRGSDKTTSAAPPSEDTAESLFRAVVRRPGLEPGRCYPLAPQASESCDFPQVFTEASQQICAENREPPQSIGGAPSIFRPGLARAEAVAEEAILDAMAVAGGAA